MKYCPSCGTQYTDDTLRFCLQDGSQLTELREAETPTVVLDETPTVTRQRIPDRSYETTPDVRDAASDERKRLPVLPLLVGVIAAAALFVAGAIATWLYLSGPKAANDNKITNVIPSSPQGNVNGTTSPRPSQTPVTNSSITPSQTPAAFDREQTEQDVSDTIEQWNEQAEDLNLNSYIENYAANVDYYNRKGASRSDVRQDKARAFTTYRSIVIQLANMKVTLDESGQTATAQFDKTWDFRGDRDSSGKVRSELRFRHDGGRWLITGERDIKVYYINR